MTQNNTKQDAISFLPSEVLSILLLDQTTNENILWATDDYADKGISSKSQMQLDQIIGENPIVKIASRSQKDKTLQSKRTKQKAEVFTPAWICNAQNNLIDNSWFGKDYVFNTPLDKKEKHWIYTKNKIPFGEELKNKKTWQDYVSATRMEITCGEAAYLTSRYDATTGEKIELKNRIGLLDRKMRVVKENVQNEADYFLWTKIAFQNIYGFEFSGDSLLIARLNLLFTFIENTQDFLHRIPTEQELKEFTQIISWNIWQMDGLTFRIPYCEFEPEETNSLQGDLFEDELTQKKDFPCKMMDWKENKIIEYRDLLTEDYKYGVRGKAKKDRKKRKAK